MEGIWAVSETQYPVSMRWRNGQGSSGNVLPCICTRISTSVFTAFFSQVNGGSIEEKVDFAVGLFEQNVPIDSVFSMNEMIDTIAITKGGGTEGVVARWGVTRLPRKTHRGLRKVCSFSLLGESPKRWKDRGRQRRFLASA